MMTSYLSLVPKYLSMHKKKSRLIIISVAIAVALVTGIFSMLDSFLQFEKIQVIHDYGNYHFLIKNATGEEIEFINNRVDVKNAGNWISIDSDSFLNGKTAKLGALAENFAPNMNCILLEGDYPIREDEVMIEEWAAEKQSLEIGDIITITLNNQVDKQYIISGIYNDIGATKASDIPGILLSISGANNLDIEKINFFLVEFKKGVNINKSVEEIKSYLNLESSRIGLNDRLLAVIGQSKNQSALGLYTTGIILFCIVLIAGVMMIYNTFNISVTERIRQFGLLRCIGASPHQIKKLVKREGLYITLKAIPIGLLAGIIMTFICTAVLKFYNPSLFGSIELFNVSTIGVITGIILGFLTVFMASLLPANKAAKVPPVNTVAGINEIKVSKKRKHGRLTHLFKAEIALGMNNAFMKKKTLILMSCSIAISIMMFLGFQVFIDFMYSAMKTNKPYTPDISIVSEEGLSQDLYKQVEDLDGTKRVYGRMFSYVNATFDASKLTTHYKNIVGNITLTEDGLFIPPEPSWLISYDKNQLKWAKLDLIEGTLSEEKLNAQNGVIAVVSTLRNGITSETTYLKLGDTIYVDTPAGRQELKVMGILRSVPFSDSSLNLTTFITTENIFKNLTDKTSYNIISIQLTKRGQEATIDKIKGLLNEDMSFFDQRQQNTEITQAFMTMAIFIYGFVIVIALISILNIVNTMNTSVASKTRYLGVMRAIGMSGEQLNKMILVEASTYSITGSVLGCVLGILLQKILITNLLSDLKLTWQFPLTQIGIILVLVILVTMLSVINPLKRIKAQKITDVMNSF